MLAYVEELNKSISQHYDTSQICMRLEQLAWACVEERLTPTTIPYDRALLAVNNEDEILQYCHERLMLIESTAEGVRFTVDPLAEYLAASFITNRFRNSTPAWDDFLARAESAIIKDGSGEGLLRALEDCGSELSWRSILPATVVPRIRSLLDKKSGRGRSNAA
jgi:hypothetical protein